MNDQAKAELLTLVEHAAERARCNDNIGYQLAREEIKRRLAAIPADHPPATEAPTPPAQ